MSKKSECKGECTCEGEDKVRDGELQSLVQEKDELEYLWREARDRVEELLDEAESKQRDLDRMKSVVKKALATVEEASESGAALLDALVEQSMTSAFLRTQYTLLIESLSQQGVEVQFKIIKKDMEE